MNFFALALTLLFATCLPALSVGLRVLPWDDDVAGRKLTIVHGKEVIDLGYLHPSARSKPIKVPAEAEGLRLVANDRSAEGGVPVSQPLKISANFKNPLLLILPDKAAKTGVRTLVIEDDDSSFPWGSIRLINVTPKPLVFRWGKNGKLVPNGWKPVDISPGGESRNMEIGLYRKEDIKKALYSAVWEHRTDMRQLVFIVPSSDASLGPYEFKFVPETKLAAEGS